MFSLSLRLLTWTIYAVVIVSGYAGILEWQVDLGKWLFEYQTLTGGLLALAGAFIGGWLLHRQTLQSDEHERTRRQGRREAIRSVLPLALSSIARYATECAQAGRTLLDQCIGESLPGVVKNVPQLPLLPLDAIDELKQLMELSSPEELRMISQIPRVIQFQSARLDSTIRYLLDPPSHIHVTTKSEIEQHVLDAAEVYARTEILFDWARREIDQMPKGTTWRRVSAALFLMNLWGYPYEGLIETVERRARGDLDTYLRDR